MKADRAWSKTASEHEADRTMTSNRAPARVASEHDAYGTMEGNRASLGKVARYPTQQLPAFGEQPQLASV